MCYDDLLNSNIPLITLDLIDYSVKVFCYLKAMNFNLKDEDLVDLSFFMSVIITDNLYSTKSIFKDFAIGEYSISANFNININSLKLYCKDTSIDIEYYYDEYFNVFFNNILNDNIIIENIYPEDIILNTLENYYINNFLYSFLSFDNKTESELIDSLKAKSLIRLNNKYKEEQKFFDINNYKDKNGYFIDKKYNKEEKEYKLLEKYGYFLDEKEYYTNPAIGREEEIKNITLIKPNKSAILVGEAGVGKTAIVEGIAYLLKSDKVPDKFKNKKIISITTSSLLAGCTLRGQFEEKVEEILGFLKDHKEVILFIDEMHTVMGAGSAKEQKLDFANILKPYLDRGDIKIIGSTTEKEYNELITDTALRRRFEKTIIKELDKDKLKIIINAEIKKLENEFSIKFDFNGSEKNLIINLLLNLTDDKNKVYNDKINNPDLVLSILSDLFANASYYNRDKILKEDIEFAISRCDRIYDSVRKREILKLSMLKEKREIPKCKVLKLYPDIS